MAASMNPADWKIFSCYNLGVANTSADPFTPTWEINGGYYQWGIKMEAAAGPSGSGAGQANSAAITGWNTSPAADNSWTDPKNTTNDPCPDGFRVPTEAEWTAVKANNTPSYVGSWTGGGITEYGNGLKFGNSLMLPAAGLRAISNGALSNRGSNGYYWSTTMSSNSSKNLFFHSTNSGTNTNNRTNGFSVRCIEEL